MLEWQQIVDTVQFLGLILLAVMVRKSQVDNNGK